MRATPCFARSAAPLAISTAPRLPTIGFQLDRILALSAEARSWALAGTSSLYSNALTVFARSSRAARAGFAGLWAGAAYVYRAPAGHVPASASQSGLDAHERNRRIYQDRLCGLRLAGTADGYRDHCLGDACEHFAPAGLITLRLPLSAPVVITGDPPRAPQPAADKAARRARAALATRKFRAKAAARSPLQWPSVRAVFAAARAHLDAPPKG